MTDRPPLPSGGHPALDAWLEAATRDLCDEARTRVALELANHAEAAYAEHLAQDLSPNNAAQRTLQTLGSAHVACHHFKKTCLTAREACLLSEIQGSLWQVSLVPALAVSIGVGLYFAGRINGEGGVMPLLWLGVLVLTFDSIPFVAGPPLRLILGQAPIIKIVKVIAMLQLLVLACYTGISLVFLMDGYQEYRRGVLDTVDSTSQWSYLHLAIFALMPVAYAWLKVAPTLNIITKLPKQPPPVQP